MSERTMARIRWLLSHMTTFPHRGFTVAWDDETVDAFVKAFPEAEAGLIVYLMGPNSSPMLNRTAKAAERLGFLRAGHVGNQDARSYNQRTWCRTWNVTDKGRQYIGREASPEDY